MQSADQVNAGLKLTFFTILAGWPLNCWLGHRRELDSLLTVALCKLFTYLVTYIWPMETFATHLNGFLPEQVKEVRKPRAT